MPVLTRTRASAAAGLVATLAALAPALPADAHGAPTRPISRTAACGARGSETGSAACTAARKANGGPIGNFDNLRIPNVNGRDRAVVPDGKLCSGGLDDYAGLDLARDDWPATRAKAGETLDLRYATTIPHQGTFRVYLTKDGYDPGRRLRWADLSAEPLLEDKDPPLRGGAYRMSVKLPERRAGRHVLYVIWQTSSTPDTYYSCSDLVLSAPAAAAPATPAGPSAEKKPAPKKTAAVVRTTEPAPAATSAAAPAPPAVTNVAAVERTDDLVRYAVPGAVLLLLVFGAPLFILIIRRGRQRIR
jgi:predicted carbohydrate-binding protein with CBM5 and CBM33 domain